MANVFGDPEVSAPELETNSFGDPIRESASTPKPSPTAQQEAFKQQFIEQGTQTLSDQVLTALTAPARAGAGLATGLADILYKGAQGVGSMAQKAADARELALSQPGFFNRLRALAGEQVGQIGDVLQTAGEVGPRAVAEGLNAARQGFFQSPQATDRTGRSIVAATNPLQGIIRALVDPQTAPTQAQAQQAFEENVLNQAISQSLEQPILQAAQEAVGLPVSTETNVDVARAAPLLLGAEALPGAISRTAAAVTPALQRVFTSIPRAAARVTPTAETAAMSALNLAKEEVQSILPSAVPNITKATGKALPNAEEIIQGAPKARKALFEETTDGLTKSKEAGLVIKGNSAADDAVQAIKSDSRYMIDKADEAEALIKKYEKYRRDIDPLEGRGFLEDTNGNLSSHWDKSAKGQKLDLTDAELRAEKAFASNLSRQVDDLYQIGSRTFNDPYRQIGKIIELEKNLKLTKAAAEKAFAERVSPSRRTGGATALSKGEAVRQIGRGATSAFRNTELELLDKNLKGAFKGAPKPLASVPVPEEAIPGLSRNYLPGKQPPPLPVAAAPVEVPVVAPPQTLEEIIQSFPAEFRRNDPAMAKIAAEAILRSQQ